MRGRVQASFDRQAMMATLGAELVSVEPGRVEVALRRGDAFADTATTPFAIMQATLTAVYDRPGIKH